MHATVAAPAETGAASALPLRVVVLGMPGAGKSSLIGALSQVAATQEDRRHGHPTNDGHAVAELRCRSCPDSPPESLDEIVPCDSKLEACSKLGVSRLQAVFVDCDGRAANAVLSRANSISVSENESRLAKTIVEAETLILVMDASEQNLDSTASEFARFLRLLQQGRGERSEVGGLPVFLVLSKCDLLAHHADNSQRWHDRIDASKQHLARCFAECLAHQPGQKWQFGGLDLHICATAVKRPRLVDIEKEPQELFGVNELLRLNLALSRSYHRRVRRSEVLLRWVAGATVTWVAVMSCLAIALVFTRPVGRPSGLADRVERLRMREEHKSPAERLREPLKSKANQLEQIRGHLDFRRLSTDDQRFIDRRLEELEAYMDYKAALESAALLPITSEIELQDAERRLQSELAPPPDYALEWNDTDAAKLRATLTDQLNDLQDRLAAARNWYSQQAIEAERWRTFADGKPTSTLSWETWLQRAQRIGQTAPPESLSAPSMLTFESVAAAHQNQLSAKARLRRLGDRIAALGLAGNLPTDVRQPLDIPADVSLGDVKTHAQRLEALYPDIVHDQAGLDLPDAVAAEIHHWAKSSYDHLLTAGRKTVSERLEKTAAGQDNAEAWKSLLSWLTDPEELREWRIVAMALAGVIDSQAPDPVSALAEFVRQDRFQLDIRQIVLEMPIESGIRPVGPFTIYKGKTALTAAPVMSLKLTDPGGRPEADGRAVSFSFLPAVETMLPYVPGEFMYATLPVTKNGDTRGWILTWARRRSETYAFECLNWPPRLHRSDEENTQGELLDSVTLTVTPPLGIPSVPDLLPVVASKKQGARER